MTDKASKTTYLSTKTSNMTKKFTKSSKTLKTQYNNDYYDQQ